MQPDLVIAGTFTRRATVDMLDRLASMSSCSNPPTRWTILRPF